MDSKYQNYLAKKEQLKQLENELREDEAQLSTILINDILSRMEELRFKKFAIWINGDFMIREDIPDCDFEFCCKHSADEGLWFEYETEISNGARLLGVKNDNNFNLVVRALLDYGDDHGSYNCGFHDLTDLKQIPIEVLTAIYDGLNDEALIKINQNYLVNNWDTVE